PGAERCERGRADRTGRDHPCAQHVHRGVLGTHRCRGGHPRPALRDPRRRLRLPVPPATGARVAAQPTSVRIASTTMTRLETSEVTRRPRSLDRTRPSAEPPPASSSCQLAEAAKTATTKVTASPGCAAIPDECWPRTSATK